MSKAGSFHEREPPHRGRLPNQGEAADEQGDGPERENSLRGEDATEDQVCQACEEDYPPSIEPAPASLTVGFRKDSPSSE
jgi:hypothetical protein